MNPARKPVAQLYLSEDEVQLLYNLRERFSTDWEKITKHELSKSEIVRRMIYYLNKKGPE